MPAQVCGGEPRDPVLPCAATPDPGPAEEQGGRPEHRESSHIATDQQGADRRQEHHQEQQEQGRAGRQQDEGARLLLRMGWLTQKGGHAWAKQL